MVYVSTVILNGVTSLIETYIHYIIVYSSMSPFILPKSFYIAVNARTEFFVTGEPPKAAQLCAPR